MAVLLLWPGSFLRVYGAPKEVSVSRIRAGESGILSYGSYACLTFNLLEPGEMKAELYYANGICAGILYGISYQDAIKHTAQLNPSAYEWKEERQKEPWEEMGRLCLRPDYKGLYRFQGIAQPEDGSANGDDVNCLFWKGQYIPVEQQYPRYAQPGRYEIRISSLKPSKVQENICFSITIVGSGENGTLTQDDSEELQEREALEFIHEPLHIEDLFLDTEKGFVNMENGTLRWSETDLYAEKEDELSFERMYRSQEFFGEYLNFAALGVGWTHTYSYYAEIFRSNMVVFTPDGSKMNYTKEYNNGWQTYPGSPYVLEEGDECFLLYEPDGDVVTFDMDGHAVKIEASDGRVTELTYKWDRLIQVQEGEKSLTFTYKGDYISTVTDQKGRSVSFSYRGSEEKELLKVRQVDGGNIRYSYDEKHNLQKALNDQGEAELEASYETSMTIGRVSQVISFRQSQMTEKTYAYDAGMDGYICVEKDEDGSKRIFHSKTDYWPERDAWALYDNNGVLIRETSVSGKTTIYDP